MPFSCQQTFAGAAIHIADRNLGGLIVFPRRKGASRPQNTVPSHPVVITKDILNNLAELSLCQAAENLGISVTALKRACRKVGISRWSRKQVLETTVIATSDKPLNLSNTNSEVYIGVPSETARTYFESDLGFFESTRPDCSIHVECTEHIISAEDSSTDIWAECGIPRSTSTAPFSCEHERKRRRSSMHWADCAATCAAAKWSRTFFGDELSLEVPVLDLPELS